MKLYCSHASPYARKCRIVLEIHELADETELILADPINDKDYRKTNPLSKVPSLVDGDLTLFDSPLICEYVDHLAVSSGKESLLRREDKSYFQIQLVHASANGIMDAAVSTVMESRRQTEHSNYWLERWHEALKSAVKKQDLNFAGASDDIHIGTIALSTALGYLDFRLDRYQWRDWNESLANWFEPIRNEPWFVATGPK